MMKEIFQDWEVNRGNWKSCGALLLYRLAQLIQRQEVPLRWLGCPLVAAYVLLVEWGLGIELNLKSHIGSGLRLYHGVGLVIHEAVVVGKNCTLRHGVTLGMRTGPDDCPVLGDHVDVGCQSVIMGRIRIGDGSVIGAGSVVLHDVEVGDVVAGNPARSIRRAI